MVKSKSKPKIKKQVKSKKSVVKLSNQKMPRKKNIQKKLPFIGKLLIDTCKHMWRHKRVFFGVIAVYLLLNIVFVKGLTTVLDVPTIKKELQETSNLHGVELGATLLGVVAGSGGGATDVAGVYQTVIFIICTLAFIWLFRQTHEIESLNKLKIKVKQPFYEGMAQLIPFILMLVLVGIHLLPMLIGLSVFATVQVNGLAVTAIEVILWAFFAFILALLSFYLISASLFSLIIVTLPAMTPMSAYKNAKKVVKNYRWVIMRKLLIFIIILMMFYGLVLLGAVMVMPFMAEWLMLIISALILPLSIGSGYKLYRSLL